MRFKCRFKMLKCYSVRFKMRFKMEFEEGEYGLGTTPADDGGAAAVRDFQIHRKPVLGNSHRFQKPRLKDFAGVQLNSAASWRGWKASTSFVSGKGSVELVENGETFFHGSAGGESAEARLGIEFGDADGGKFLDQFVDADFAVLGELAKTGVLVVRKADGESAHGKLVRN